MFRTLFRPIVTALILLSVGITSAHASHAPTSRQLASSEAKNHPGSPAKGAGPTKAQRKSSKTTPSKGQFVGTRGKHSWHAPYVPAGWPKYVLIPKLHIKAPVEDNPLMSKKDYDAPFRWGDVSWYDLGPKPGNPGRAVIFGHLDSYTGPAVFYLLRYLEKGDIVQVQYKTGPLLSFRVGWDYSYWNNQLPLNFMYGPNRDRGLILVTCSGFFHRDGSGYDHKLLVYAHLVS